jgi:hypothetical protein
VKKKLEDALAVAMLGAMMYFGWWFAYLMEPPL